MRRLPQGPAHIKRPRPPRHGASDEQAKKRTKAPDDSAHIARPRPPRPELAQRNAERAAHIGRVNLNDSNCNYRPTLVSLGSGIGGGILGPVRAGFQCIAHWDKCPNANRVIKALPEAQGSLAITADMSEEVHVHKILARSSVDLVTASWSCRQNTSLNRGVPATHPKRLASFDFIERAIELQPRIIVIENVAAWRDGASKKNFEDVLKRLQQASYSTDCYTMNSNKLGSPTSRNRLIILASKMGPKLLHRLDRRMASAKPTSISQWLEQQQQNTRLQNRFKSKKACYTQPRPSPSQPRLIGLGNVYPCITGDCLDPIDFRFYRRTARDASCTPSQVLVPNAADLLSMLGFPENMRLADDEIITCACGACPTSKVYPRSARAVQIGNSWSPILSEAIAEQLFPIFIRDRPSLAFHAVATAEERLSPAIITEQLADIRLQDGKFVFIGETAAKKYLNKRDGIPGGGLHYAPEDTAAGAVTPTTMKNTLDELKNPTPYVSSDVARPDKLPAAIAAKVEAILAANKDAFLDFKDELPPIVTDAGGNPIHAKFRFKDDASPQRCPRPRFPPGSAKRQLLEEFASRFISQGLIEPVLTSQWASRPLLVPKFTMGESRSGVPDSLRFTIDMVSVNSQLDKECPTIGDVMMTLHKAAGHKFYCAFDIASAFYSFGLDEEAMHASTVWLPHEGQVRLMRWRRLPMGMKNSTSLMNSFYQEVLGELPAETQNHTAQLADDLLVYADTMEECLRHFQLVLKKLISRRIKIKPPKCRVLFNEAEYFGFTISETGVTPAPRNVDATFKVEKPESLEELRRVLGVWNFYSHFITASGDDIDKRTGKPRVLYYKELTRPLIDMTKTTAAGSFKERWGDNDSPASVAFRRVKAIFQTGIHLFAWDQAKPLQMTVDASKFGWGACMYQLGPEGQHHAVRHFNGAWTAAQRKLPPYFLEGVALVKAMREVAPFQRMSEHTLTVKSDHLPLSFLRNGNGMRAISFFDLLDFQDIDFRIDYISGPRNVVADALSRGPFLGPLCPGVRGLLHMTKTLLRQLGDTHRAATKIFIAADIDTAAVAGLVKDWRHQKAKAPTRGTLSQFRNEGKPNPDFDFAIIVPPIETCARDCAILFKTGKPFAAMIPTTLMCRIPETNDRTIDRDVQERLLKCGRIVFSADEYCIIVGNSTFAKHICFHAVVRCKLAFNRSHINYILSDARGAGIACLAAKFRLQIPGFDNEPDHALGSLKDWAAEQKADTSKLQPADRVHIHFRDSDGLAIYRPHEDLGRVFVPTKHRKALIIQTHERLLHLAFNKVYSHLRASFWWPTMRKQCQATLATCAACQLAKHQKHLAHRSYRVKPSTMPRMSLGFDFKEMGKSDAGHKQLCCCVDLTAHTIALWPQRTRSAKETCQGLLDNVVNKWGVPIQFHSDHAKELIGTIITDFWRPYQVQATTTRGYSPTGNATCERVFRYVNTCFRVMSDKQYAHWQDFVSTIEAAWNSTTHSSINCTPFEASHGVKMRAGSEFFPVSSGEPQDMDGATLTIIQKSAAAFNRAAKANDLYAKTQRAMKLNAAGRKVTYKVGDLVRIFFPPSAAEVKRAGRMTKHLCHYKGPLRIVQVIGNTGYKVVDIKTGMHYERTLPNIASWQGADAEGKTFDEGNDKQKNKRPTSSKCKASTGYFREGDFIAARCDRLQDRYWIGKIIEVLETEITMHIHATWNQSKSATFHAVYVDPKDNKKMTSVPNGKTADSTRWTDTILASDIPSQIVARNLKLTATNKLTAPSRTVLDKLPGSITMATLRTP